MAAAAAVYPLPSNTPGQSVAGGSTATSSIKASSSSSSSSSGGGARSRTPEGVKPSTQQASLGGASSAAQRRGMPFAPLLGLAGGVAALGFLIASLLRRRRSNVAQPDTKAGAAQTAGPCSKLKPTAKLVPLADGSACVVRREIAADNSCLFNSVGYVMHRSKIRAPHLRNVVAQQVSSDRTTYSDAFLGMTNEAYCQWIRQPYNWGGGIELSILAQAYGMEIAAWNIETKKSHVFGEESGYKRQVMVIYNGVHYDALAVCAGPRANPDDDETDFNPRTKRGKMILAATAKLVELAHKQSPFNKSSGVKSGKASTCASEGSGQGGSGAKAGPSSSASRTTRGGKAKAGGGSVHRLRCGDCGEVLAGSAAVAQHAKATGHTSYEEVA